MNLKRGKSGSPTADHRRKTENGIDEKNSRIAWGRGIDKHLRGKKDKPTNSVAD